MVSNHRIFSVWDIKWCRNNVIVLLLIFFRGSTEEAQAFSFAPYCYSPFLYEIGARSYGWKRSIQHGVMNKGVAACSSKSTVSFDNSDLGDDGIVDGGCLVTGITLKIAVDREGSVGMESKEDFGRFTSEESLDMVHRLRKDCQGVLVGRVTVERDDCTLTVRRGVTLSDKQEQPSRILLDPNLALFSPHQKPYKVLRQADARTYIFHSKSSTEAKSIFNKWKIDQNVPATQQSHVTLVSLQNNIDDTTAVNNRKLDPVKIWSHLSSELKMSHILVEGGPTTAKAFLPIVDRIILVKANNVQFVNNPIPLGLSVEDLSSTHHYLGNASTTNCEDTWFYFSKDGLWPTSDLQQWP